MQSRHLQKGKRAQGCAVRVPGSITLLSGVVSSATPCCMQHCTVQLGMTDFAAVLHPHYVLQQNLSGFVFTFILKVAVI